ncbi:MAG: hypothetical protein JO102_05480, partial [Elusimicrobia bacterium]|nr:hypothetical protein [Elusimicrobiota bacterium]
ERKRNVGFADLAALDAAIRPQNPRLADKLKRSARRLSFTLLPRENVALADRYGLAGQVELGHLIASPAGTLGAAVAALPATSFLSPIQAQLADFLARGFLSEAEAKDVLRLYQTRLVAGSVSRAEAATRILAGLTRRAYWEESPTNGHQLRPRVRAAYRAAALALFDRLGYTAPAMAPDIERYVDEAILKELAGLGFTDDNITIDPSPVRRDTGLRLPVNREGKWVLASFEDETIRKILRRAMPFASSQAPYEEFMLRETSQLLDHPGTSTVAEFYERHRRFWYSVLKPQLDQRWEMMRDIREGVVWDYAFTWEEFADSFRFLLGKSEWGAFPPAWTAAGAPLQARQAAFGASVRRLRVADIPAADVPALVADAHSLIDEGRAKLGIPKFHEPLNQSLFTLRPFYHILTNAPLFRRFLGDSSTGQSLREQKAAFFWLGVAIVMAAFVSYLLFFVVGQFPLLPIAWKVNLGFATWTIPVALRWVAMIATILPLGDAIILTYFSVANVAKAVVGATVGRFYKISTVRTWKDFRKKLPELLRDPEVQVDFRRLIEHLAEADPHHLSGTTNQHFLTTAERAAFMALLTKAAATPNAVSTDDVPASLAIEKTVQRMKSWANKKIREDAPREPRNYKELKSMTFQISGWTEDFWYDWNSLIKVEGGALEHRMGMIARAFPDEWRVMLSRLVEGGKLDAAQREFFLSL